MWLVLAALRKPITIIVVILAVMLAAIGAIRQMSIDIFPDMGSPVLYVAQPYGGMSPAEMEGFICEFYEFHFFYVGGVKEVESHSIQGLSLIKLTFYPGTDMGQAISEVTAMTERARAFAPPGTVPPFLLRFDAGSVPVGDLVFSSKTRTLGEIQDLALYRVRPMFASLPGVTSPPPIGGNQRTIVFHAYPDKLRQYNLSAAEVVQAISRGNVVNPAGNIRVGDKALMVPTNSVVPEIKSIENIPINVGDGPAVYLRDVGYVEDSSDIVAGYALVDGKRTIYIPVCKRSSASTWTVVQEVKASLQKMQEALPSDVKVAYEFDQSYYVKNAMTGLIFEGSLGALLTALVIYLFLRNLRSALIVAITIPVSILTATFCLFLCKQTINIMTLGGLALAIGILVDQTTVTIENIFSHRARAKSFARSVIDSAQEISKTVLLVLVCVLIVFVPSFFMGGVPGALFMPMSLAVSFAMVASFLLSQTLVPILVIKFMSHQTVESHESHEPGRLQKSYYALLDRLFNCKKTAIIAYFIACVLLLAAILPFISIELFPAADAGQFRLRVKAPVGTRIKVTESVAHDILNLIAKTVGPENVKTTLSYVGMQPVSYPNINVYLWTNGPHEAVINVALNSKAKINMPELKDKLRAEVKKQYPKLLISFEPGDMVGQVTSMGSPTPVEIAMVGMTLEDDKIYADKLLPELEKIPALRDLQFGEAIDYPSLMVNIDRVRAGKLGIRVDEITKALVAATSSSRFTVPVFWLDISTGNNYNVQVEIAQSTLHSAEDLKALPATLTLGSRGPFIRDVTKIEPNTQLGEIHRLNARRILTLTANVYGDNLRKVAVELQEAIKRAGPGPRGMTVLIRSQVQLLMDTLGQLEQGLVIAIIAIFLLLAANFQSFRIALVSLTTVPSVIVGCLLVLFLTGTSLNIQSYLGTIMSIGISVANSILLVTFAENRWHQLGDAEISAKEAGKMRLRPILMTAISMVAGMVPMALALSEGGAQSAPLGRAVIGGLVVSTFATLLILPLVFSYARKNTPITYPTLDPDDRHSEFYDAPKIEE
jgi:multidrug efflux pump subunit AcrB